MNKRILMTADHIGADDELGRLLARNFLYAVARNSEPPVAVMLMHSAVRLACEGSESLDDLKLLEESGVTVASCGTCLDYLGLKDQLAVGQVGTMLDGVSAMLGDDAVLTIR